MSPRVPFLALALALALSPSSQWPWIAFFTNEDLTGLLDLWNWEKPLRSLVFLVILTYVFANPWLIWTMIQVLGTPRAPQRA